MVGNNMGIALCQASSSAREEEEEKVSGMYEELSHRPRSQKVRVSNLRMEMVKDQAIRSSSMG
jgi:hypothetical protein